MSIITDNNIRDEDRNNLPGEGERPETGDRDSKEFWERKFRFFHIHKRRCC